MKRNRLVTALLSIAALGLTSVGLQAQDATVDMTQLRERLQMGKTMERPELTPELQALVDQFRATRAEMIAAYRENRAETKALIDELRAKCASEGWTEEQKAEFRAQLKTLVETHQGEVRAFRHQLRDEMRAIREQIREQQGTVEG
ncbi:MAG: hypothetical protein R3F07_02655 [Opitutaceae bacterium]